ncbi:gfo/Idh/MocA family oxidoreductase [Cohnella endophytica]|uniref:Gfo/Idh/MocA family oxidoreductase n=1 Tax=Cohnella endophytica TaxID=2419778 RepID=A0A494XX55_9BACL|nr:Gfo/Idh/MocA family oxidoreductase [Cohnella endophytica]RKP55157.1 gfo/Idh/MocA family oxidoreductase [Cohnella endophytica]
MGKVKIGVVGLNFGSAIIAELTSKAGAKWFELAGVCDLDADKTRSYAIKYGVRAFASLDELLGDEEIRAIGLFTPPVGRAALIDRIISAGKDVITTKPFELDVEQGIGILKKAERLGRVIHLNSPSPWLPSDLQLLKQWHERYELGQPVACRAEVWCDYRERFTGTWYDDSEQCPVAPIYRIGIYLINDIVRLFGEADQVQVMHSRLFTERPTPDNAQLGIKFKNGAIGNIFASFCVDDGQAYKYALIVNYEKGTVYRNILPKRFDENGDNFESEMMLVTQTKDEPFHVERASLPGAVGQYQWEAFYRAIQGERSEQTVSAGEIIEGIKIIRAMSKAEKSGRSEKV